MIQPYQTLLLLVTAGLTHVNGSNNNNTVTSRQRFLAHNNTPDEQKLKLSEHPSNISHSNFSNTFFIVITIGFIISLGLIFLWVVRRTSRKNASLSDCNRTEGPEHSHFNMKCPTIAVSESSHSCQFDKTDSIESLVPVLDDNTSKYKIPETLQQEMKLSWTEVSAGTTSSYNGAALSTHQSRSAAPMLTNAPAQRREVNENQAPASDRSSHTDEYSIDMLESPASTEYSFSSESDDFFPSTCWDVDSYRSASSTFLSTTSSNVFGSNHGRNSGVWKQVYGPDNTPPLGLGQSPLSSGALFVRDIDPDAIRRTRLDTRVYGARSTNRMRLDIEL